MSDEEFREFHLDGKHLAFLVISGIGVAVVVFLCGVLVGRGVRAPRAVAAADFSTSALDEGPIGSESLDGAPSSTDSGARVSGRESSRSDKSSVPFAEPDPEPVALGPAESPAPPAAPTSSEKAPATPAAKPAAPSPASVPRGPTGSQWVVQVVSGTSRSSAESLAARLKSKGYDAFISEYPQGTQQYRVRIGTFAKKSEAQAVANRLERDGKYKKPWVTTR